MDPRKSIAITNSEAESLLAICARLPRITTKTSEVPLFNCVAATAVAACSGALAFKNRIQEELLRVGYAVVDFRSLSAEIDLNIERTEMTAILASLGTPIQVFESWPLWKPIETKPEIEPWRAGGIGLIPLHMDFVNCECPPDYSCLFCLVEDPEGGGQTTVSKIASASKMLNTGDTNLLMQSVFSNGQVVNLRHVGRDLNPFAVINPGAAWPIRFSAKMLCRMEDSVYKRALQAFNRHLQEEQATFPLRRFELLIVDQRLLVHGRLPLGGNQAAIVPSARRLLHQVFVRTNTPKTYG